MAFNKLITAYNNAGFNISATATPNVRVTIVQGKYTPAEVNYLVTQDLNQIITQNGDNIIAQGV